MRIYRKMLREITNAFYALRSSMGHIKDTVQYDVPYVCQFAHPNHSELSLKGMLDPKDDKYWPNTGANSPEQYAKWAFTMCGMACTSMALDYFTSQTIKPVLLAEDAFKDGVYNAEKSGGLSSMQYFEFSRWIRKHNIEGKVISRLTIRGIQFALSNNSLVIVSVNPNIRGYNSVPVEQQGGHLVIVTGYNQNAGIITFNNPSGFANQQTQVGHTISIAEFRKYYAGRGIILSSFN